MSITITLSESLASQLQAQAQAQQLSLEEWALCLLGRAAAGDAEPFESAWNSRRVALIRKGFTNPLTSNELAELDQLQRMADKHLEAQDRQRLEDVHRMRELVRQAASGSDS